MKKIVRNLRVYLIVAAILSLALASCTPGTPATTQEAPVSEATDEVPAPPNTGGGDEEDTAGEEQQGAGGNLADEQVLRIGLNGNVQMLDPHRTSSVWDHAILNHIFSGLLRYNWNTRLPEPDLATDWEISDDGLEYVFHLREGVQWHRGFGEFTANDVKFSIERVLDPNSQSIFASEFDLIESVDVVDDYTVRINLSSPYIPLLDKLAALKQGFIVSQKAVEEYGEDIATNAIGTGPFMLETWDPTNEIVLTANPDYYAGPPTLERIVIVPIEELTTLTVALESGDVDIIEVTDATTYQQLLSNENITVVQSPSFNRVSIGLNTTVEPLNEVKVRQALAYAIDLDTIIDELLKDVAERAYSFLGPLDFGYTEDIQIYNYDPDQARQLLAEAGYADGFEVTAVYPVGAASGILHKCLTAIQGYWADIGVTLNLETPDTPVAISAMADGNIAIGGATTSRPPEPDYVLSVYFDEDGAWNYIHYDIQDLLEQGRSETDLDARRAIYEEVQRRIAEDVPAIPLAISVYTIAMQDYVKGMVPDLFRGYWAYDVYIEDH